MIRVTLYPCVLLSGAVTCGALLLTGCSGASSSPAQAAGTSVAATADAPAKSMSRATKTAITPVDKAGYENAIAAHRGRVVLVDYWATWCGPCVKQFPHTVELWRKFHDRGLDVIGLSFDDADDASIEGVAKFLSEKGADFENLISKVGIDQAADEFDFDGALPHYVIYGRDGKFVHRLSPSDPTIRFTPDLIDTAIEEQLAARP